MGKLGDAVSDPTDSFDCWWNSQDSDEWIKVADAAEMARKHPNTIRSWCAYGHLTWIKTGGTYLISRSSLKEYLRSCGDY